MFSPSTSFQDMGLAQEYIGSGLVSPVAALPAFCRIFKQHAIIESNLMMLD